MAEKDQDKTRMPQQQRSVETKQKIVAAATKLFAKNGYHNTNTKDIAKEAKVAIGSVYSYYTDKMEIFKDALLFYNERFIEVLRSHSALQLDTRKNKLSFIREMIETMIKAHQVDVDFHREMNIMALSYLEIKDMSDKQMQLVYAFVAQLLRSWQSEIRIKDLDAAATILVLGAHSVVEAIAFASTDVSRERLIGETIDMLHCYLWPQEVLQDMQNEEDGL